MASRTRSMLHDPAWSMLLSCEPILEVLERVFPEGGECIAGGGDFVAEHTKTYQPIHSDINVPRSLNVPFPPPYVSFNFAVHPVNDKNGPMRILPGTQVLSRQVWNLPSVEDEPQSWLTSTLQPLTPGDVIVRDVRSLHGGTPNLSSDTRFLPSLEFASAALREKSRADIWPVPHCLPHESFVDLPPRAQEWCFNLVAPRSEIDIGWV